MVFSGIGKRGAIQSMLYAKSIILGILGAVEKIDRGNKTQVSNILVAP